jgi:DNA polymerase-3 subunit delta
MNVTQAMKKLQSNTTKVCVCYGSESYLIDSFIHSLTKTLIPQEYQDMAISKYDMRETSLSTIIEDAETAPFLVPTKLIIASYANVFTASRDTGKSEKDQSKTEHPLDDLIHYMQSPAPYTMIVFVVHADKLDDRKKVVKLLKSQDMLFPFYAMQNQELRSWIRVRVDEEGFRMSDDAIDTLIAHTNGNLLLMHTEINKLRSYVGPGGLAEAFLIQQFVARTLEQNIFLLVDHVVGKQLDRAMRILDDLLRQKEEPIKIAILIVRQFRIILQVKQLSLMGYSESQIASQISVAPYAVKVAQTQARKYEFAQLAEIMNHLADLDYQMKSGKIDKVLGLEMFFLKITC